MIARTDEIPESHKDGRLVLIYAVWGWETLTHYRGTNPEWRVAQYETALSYDDECQPVPGWQAPSTNPYKDYAPAVPLAWFEIPLLPAL